jgi:AcrR family transcriptional regulator
MTCRQGAPASKGRRGTQGEPTRRRVDNSQTSTRDRIKSVAQELYVRRGHDGFSFGDIAEIIGVTRANIHHHFGNKRRLMTELIEGFAADAEKRIERHWLDGEATLPERLSSQLRDLAEFYQRFNAEPGSRNVWSPVSRLRLDLQALGEPAEKALEQVNRAYDRCLRQALSRAVRSGELSPTAPVEEIARILRVALLSAPPMTQDTGQFEEIAQMFKALERTVIKAWAPPNETPPGQTDGPIA